MSWPTVRFWDTAAGISGVRRGWAGRRGLGRAYWHQTLSSAGGVRRHNCAGLRRAVSRATVMSIDRLRGWQGDVATAADAWLVAAVETEEHPHLAPSHR